MTTGIPGDRDRLVELLCDAALDGLSADGQAELGGHLAAHPDVAAFGQRLELAAAAIDLAALPPLEAMPAHVGARVWAQAGQTFAPAPAPAPTAAPAPVVPLRAPGRGETPRRDRLRWAGWLAAAACFLLAIAAWIPRLIEKPVARLPEPPPTAPAPAPAPPEPPKTATPAEGRTELLADADAVRARWSAAKDPLGKGVEGDVVWSPSKQRGYMRLSGLAPNDPQKSQYQLWIFDKNQDQATPVDGGVFDVTASGDVVVPITAKLHVAEPTLFAVTVEKPGGVVVSKRDRLVVVASVSG